jgi:DNA-binding NarL/FixJ family response regulator
VIRLFVIDDHPIIRAALRRLADREPDIRAVGDAGSIPSAIPLIETISPGVVTIAVETWDHVALEDALALRERFPRLGVVVLAAEPDDELLVRAMHGGVTAFVVKRASIPEILDAVRFAASGSPAAMVLGMRSSHPGLRR